MNESAQSVHDAWSPADEQFFRCTADLFVPEFLWGAGTLLASYDEVLDVEPGRMQAPCPAGALPSRQRAALRAAHLPPCG
jgi:hypothetical protein